MPKAKAQQQVSWEEVLAKLSDERERRFIFPREGQTKVRLIKIGDEYYREVEATFQTRKKKKYLLLAVDMSESEPSVKGLIVSKTVFRGIVSLILEGYELWNLEHGYGVTIIRTGSGLDTTYSVLPSKKPVPIDSDVVKDAPNLEELSREYQEGRSTGNGEKGGEDW